MNSYLISERRGGGNAAAETVRQRELEEHATASRETSQETKMRISASAPFAPLSDNCSRRGHHLPPRQHGDRLKFLEHPGWFSGAAVLNLIMGVVLGYFGYMA
jgi:hypothetical protein